MAIESISIAEHENIFESFCFWFFVLFLAQVQRLWEKEIERRFFSHFANEIKSACQEIRMEYISVLKSHKQYDIVTRYHFSFPPLPLDDAHFVRRPNDYTHTHVQTFVLQKEFTRWMEWSASGKIMKKANSEKSLRRQVLSQLILFAQFNILYYTWSGRGRALLKKKRNTERFF